MIKGGYIIQPRIIQESDISVAPPYVREIWNYLLRQANACDKKYNGHEIKRGQLFRTYADIRDGTKWFVGWRKMMYNENHTKKAMKFLRDTQRIATKKELGGVLITILKYDYYQNPKNYERTTKAPTGSTIEEPSQNHPLLDNNKNDKKDKNVKKGDLPQSSISVCEKTDFIDQIIKEFSDAYEKWYGISYEITASGKERSAAGRLLKIYKNKYPEANSLQALEALRGYFENVVGIDDSYIQNSMSLPIIVSKFNDINKILKNGKYREHSKKAGSDAEFAAAIAKNLQGWGNVHV